MKFLMVYFGVFFFLLSGITTNKAANSLIQNSCKKVSKYREDYYKLCIASMEENQESKKARNIIELTVVAVKNARTNMTNVKGIAEKFQKEKKYKTKSYEESFRLCLKYYTNGTNSLTKALEYIKIRDDKRVYESIAYARLVPESCEMNLNLFNNTSPLKKENDILYKLVDIPQIFMLTMPI